LRRIMILGASCDQVQMIRKASELGYETCVCDRNAKAVGAAFANIFVKEDTSNISGLLRVAEEYKIDGIATMATNLAIRSAAFVAHSLNLPCVSIDSAMLGTDKAWMRDACKGKEFLFAEGLLLKSLDDVGPFLRKVGYPVIFKPSDSSGCRGLRIAEIETDLELCYETARWNSTRSSVVIEKFYRDGLVFGLEALVGNGNFYPVMISDKIVRTVSVISTAGVNIPSKLNEEQKGRACEIAEVLTRELGIDMGGVHIDFILDNGNPRVIDYAPRLAGGSLVFNLIKKLTGVDMIEFVLKQAMNEPFECNVAESNDVGIDRFLYSPIKGEVALWNWHLTSGAIGEWRKDVGSFVDDEADNRGRLAWVSIIDSTMEGAKKQFEEIIESVTLRIREKDGNIRSCSPVVYNG